MPDVSSGKIILEPELIKVHTIFHYTSGKKMKTILQNLAEGDQAFCIIQKQDGEDVLILEGEPISVENLDDIPRKSGKALDGKRYDSISVVPYSQIRERGYLAKNTGEKILTLDLTRQSEIPLETLLALLPCDDITLEKEITFDTSTESYEKLIQRIVEDEIGNGEGANFVIPRTSRGKISEFSVRKAFTIFKSLLKNDYGTYWKFMFYNGDRFFIGSTPERHLLVEGKRVKMNPISGTFRKDKPYAKRVHFKEDLLEFLKDQKEINELFMVVDEELKMMAKMCGKGGAIVGPLLKEMSQLIHSEYLLSGVSDKDVLELFKESMFAATVTGSPVENACNIIYKYSDKSRGYYGSALMLLGHDENGHDYLDSPITIRTVEINEKGDFLMAVGATLVRDSVPAEEVKETEAKSAALVNSIVNSGRQNPTPPLLSRFANDDDIAETLQQRNQYLSNFWFFKQEIPLQLRKLGIELTITIIHNEDDFAFMLKHVFSSLGAKTTVVSYREYDFSKDKSAITVVGPGPGNPNETDKPKMRQNMTFTRQLLESGKKALFVCLGHQFLCKHLGYAIEKKTIPYQGVQKKITLFGAEERVGFYNTFVPKPSIILNDVELSVDAADKEIVAIRGRDFMGFQFHPESILTKNGDRILMDSILYLLKEE